MTVQEIAVTPVGGCVLEMFDSMAYVASLGFACMQGGFTHVV